MTEKNGTRSALLAILVTIALAFSGWALATTVSHGERIAKTETQIEGVRESLDGIRGWLRSMDAKLDELRRR